MRTEMPPSGYTGEVSGAVTIAPDGFVLFSVPTNHIGGKDNNGTMEIPFGFDVPRGRGPRDEVIGGEPIMSLRHSHYDMPQEANAKITKLK